jgi:hypothetical protein
MRRALGPAASGAVVISDERNLNRPLRALLDLVGLPLLSPGQAGRNSLPVPAQSSADLLRHLRAE